MFLSRSEQIPSTGRGRTAQFGPDSICAQKSSPDEKPLLALMREYVGSVSEVSSADRVWGELCDPESETSIWR